MFTEANFLEIYALIRVEYENNCFFFRLNGKTNTVYTGVAIKYGDHIETFTEATKVQFGNCTDEQIKAYVDTGEPL